MNVLKVVKAIKHEDLLQEIARQVHDGSVRDRDAVKRSVYRHS